MRGQPPIGRRHGGPRGASREQRRYVATRRHRRTRLPGPKTRPGAPFPASIAHRFGKNKTGPCPLAVQILILLAPRPSPPRRHGHVLLQLPRGCERDPSRRVASVPQRQGRRQQRQARRRRTEVHRGAPPPPDHIDRHFPKSPRPNIFYPCRTFHANFGLFADPHATPVLPPILPRRSAIASCPGTRPR